MHRISGFILGTLVLTSFMSAGVHAQEASKYHVLISTVKNQQDAYDLVEIISVQTSIPIRVIPFERKFYVVAGEFTRKSSATEVAKDDIFKSYSQLDILRVVSDKSVLEQGGKIYQIQLGNFSGWNSAATLQEEAISRGLHPVIIVEMDQSFKVRYGRFSSREAAQVDIHKVQKAGYSDAWVADHSVDDGGPIFKILRIESMGSPWEPPKKARSRLPAKRPVFSIQNLSAPIKQKINPSIPQETYELARARLTPDVVVTTKAVSEAVKKIPIPIEVRADGADEVILHYRLRGGKSFMKVQMKPDEQEAWTAEIPGWAVTSLGIEYYIQAKKGYKRYTSEATKESPYGIAVK